MEGEATGAEKLWKREGMLALPCGKLKDHPLRLSFAGWRRENPYRTLEELREELLENNLLDAKGNVPSQSTIGRYLTKQRLDRKTLLAQERDKPPRLRGTAERTGSGTVYLDKPPRLRGTAIVSKWPFASIRITPAPAGNRI